VCAPSKATNAKRVVTLNEMKNEGMEKLKLSQRHPNCF